MEMKKVIQNSAERVKAEMESITPFRWHYYSIVLLSLLLFSSIVTRVCGNLDREACALRTAPNAAVQCLGQLHDLVALLKGK
jgi:hypothetical protein